MRGDFPLRAEMPLVGFMQPASMMLLIERRTHAAQHFLGAIFRNLVHVSLHRGHPRAENSSQCRISNLRLCHVAARDDRGCVSSEEIVVAKHARTRGIGLSSIAEISPASSPAVADTIV